MSAMERLVPVADIQSADLASTVEPNVIKRAFEIAPQCGSLTDLKRRLILEGYFQVNAHLSGWKIRRELMLKLNRELPHHVPRRIVRSEQ